MKCIDCNKEMKLVVENHKYEECGLSNIILVDVKKYRCSNCGEEYLGIQNPLGLHAVIAKTVVKNKRKLSGKEFRFLRTYLGFSTAVFAKLIGVARETVSRWETGKLVIPKHMDLLIRSLAVNNEPDRNYKLHDLFLKEECGKAFSRLKIVCKKSGEWEIKSAA